MTSDAGNDGETSVRFNLGTDPNQAASMFKIASVINLH
jgi:hypothetical protein